MTSKVEAGPLWPDERIDKAAMDDGRYPSYYEASRSALRKMREEYEVELTRLRTQLEQAKRAEALRVSIDVDARIDDMLAQLGPGALNEANFRTMVKGLVQQQGEA